MYYLLTSDYLNVPDEKYIIYFLFRYAMKKSEKEIRLLLHSIRFTYLPLKLLLDLGRDHLTIRKNNYFVKRFKFELCRKIKFETTKQAENDKNDKPN